MSDECLSAMGVRPFLSLCLKDSRLKSTRCRPPSSDAVLTAEGCIKTRIYAGQVTFLVLFHFALKSGIL